MKDWVVVVGENVNCLNIRERQPNSSLVLLPLPVRMIPVEEMSKKKKYFSTLSFHF